MTVVDDPDESARVPWRACLRGVRAAAAVLTRVPVGGFPYHADEWRWSAAHLPIVGAAVGMVASMAWVAAMGAGPFVAAVVVVATTVALTGALHEDGLADSADALGGGESPERVFAILKDHAIGAYGACALGLALLLRVATLEHVAARLPSIYCFTCAASRLAPTALLAALPYVTPHAAKSASLASAAAPQVAVAAAWTLVVGEAASRLGGLPWTDMLFALGAGAGAALACGAYFRKRVGGVTGDFLGASQQAVECAMLLTFAVVDGHP
jgi:adenosylcobinamide-GDP ribazoletransferase